ncbi:hypothetical protein E2562_015495 [Oryza meyeriana var. granulata]|uniref:Uncharacterized protein n=1 Tax=Oryza meyeriana var. granulata TaxID=110450 RepID=A0A6G1CQ69_9ORYZ|nr:hypothetical protein E2562_015495 [Oryza meyeriana var. granulata]
MDKHAAKIIKGTYLSQESWGRADSALLIRQAFLGGYGSIAIKSKTNSAQDWLSIGVLGKVPRRFVL